MNELLVKSKSVSWEGLGFQTMFECNDEAHAIEICGLWLHAYADQLKPEILRLESDIEHDKHHAASLHEHLYDRPTPVNDAVMLTHILRIRIVLALAALTATTSVVSNFAMFWLLAWGVFWSAVAAVAITALPLGLGHLAYEKLLSGHKGLQVAVIVVIAALGCNAVYQFGKARQTVMDEASAQSATRSYVDGQAEADSSSLSAAHDDDERNVHGTMGTALFMMSLAAELALGFLVGVFVQVRTDADYAAWRKLRDLRELVAQGEEQVAERGYRIEIAKRQCMAGIRRAQNTRHKRHAPYHKALLVLALGALIHVPLSHSQSIEHAEGILIDTSGSISKGGTGELFHQYLRSTKNLLATEPPNSRVWVSSIAKDSFGGVHEIIGGWTPAVHGVLTGDLDRARRQLAANFEMKSSALTANATGTDIFGGLSRLKTLFESVPNSSAPGPPPSKALWIFSDMMNETAEFPMPQLLELGPERMLERAKTEGLVVPLPHYQIHIYGASTTGLTPHSWETAKRFWELYFTAAGADLITYSAECEVRR